MDNNSHACPECGEVLNINSDQTECPHCRNAIKPSHPVDESKTPKAASTVDDSSSHEPSVRTPPSVTVRTPDPMVKNTTEQPPNVDAEDTPAFKAKRASQRLLRASKEKAQIIFSDLKEISLKEEVLPIDSSNIQVLIKDFVFWSVFLLGIVPLLIVTIQGTNAQLTLFSLFFGFVWSVIFKTFVLKDLESWKWPIASLFFTGIVGIWLLFFFYEHFLPNFYNQMPQSKNAFVSLLGSVFHTGIWEEAFKALPILTIVLWKRSEIKPLHLITIGVFSGLGFAAFENLHYGELMVTRSFLLIRESGVDGLTRGVKDAMIVAMLRSLSLVFSHAVWSGILAYFVATAIMRQKKMAALIIIGVAVSTVLHGVYNWFLGVQATIAALIAGFSFTLFYGYLSKLKGIESLQEAQNEA